MGIERPARNEYLEFRAVGANCEARFKNPEAMRTRRETVEHPFGTLKMRMGCHALLDEDAAQGRH